MLIAIESPDEPDVRALITELDDYPDTLYPVEARYALDISSLCQTNDIFAVTKSTTGNAIACGVIVVEEKSGELKRLFVKPAYRGQGIAQQLLNFLEEVASQQGCKEVLLETGPFQPEALAFYERQDYQRRAAFGDYPEHPFSVFMGKRLNPVRLK